MSTDAVTAIVPLRTGGKTRLSPALAGSERADLATAMLSDVATALRAAGIDRIVVAAQGPSALASADALGLEALPDPGEAQGLDHALRRAAGRLGPVRCLLVVAADLPRLTGPDVQQVLACEAPVVVAPTRDGGTGGLLRRPSDAIATAYGPGSAAAHVRLATDAGIAADRVGAPGFADDVDTPADLERLQHGPLGAATSRVLARLDLPRRVAG
jgi:2-phospho-L-lactate/phosphoenolpyruvate guanylyltransferase